MIELTCEKCPVTNRDSLTCQACCVSFELREVLKKSLPLREVLESKSCSVKYRDKKLIDTRFTLMNKQISAFKKILLETTQFADLEAMNLGGYEISIETIFCESNKSWDVRVLLCLPKEIADPNYCFIKI